MTTNSNIPAAQYLRMSTERQQYSLENQALAIQRYAELHGFEIVQTYSDAAKSGVVLKYRTGLRQLLQDVVSAVPNYRAILVYDISRWGRFQDTDESAHYEFLCKSAGVPVHYCAEQFVNDGSLPSLIMKALKRTMAGEYSRELGVKVFEGQKRLASLGFKQGGPPGYGLRRMLVSPDRRPKQQLAAGERKSIATDRVILVPGPPSEVQVVRDIYRMHISEKRSFSGIARTLNRKGVPLPSRPRWDCYTVKAILTNPKYAGFAVYGRISKKLHTPLRRIPKSEWTTRQGAFEPIVDLPIFEEAQRTYQGRTFNKTNDDLLNDLQALFSSKGRLTWNVIKASPEIAGPTTYSKRFGSLRNAYRLVGYADSGQFERAETRLRIMAVRKELMSQIVDMFPDRVSVVRPAMKNRTRLRLSNGLTVSVLVVRSQLVWKNARRWIIERLPSERKFITLLARMDESNRSILDLHILPNMKARKKFSKKFVTDSLLARGKRFTHLSQFLQVVRCVRSTRSH